MSELKDLNNIITILNQGGLILYPTDTIWGLGCDPFNQDSIQRLNYLKNRDPEKKFILLVDSISHLKRHVPHIHPRVETLLYYHTHPLTVVYQNPIHLPDFLINEDGTIAIRITQNPFCKELIKEFDKPIISTSANKSGEPFPQNKGEIDEDIIHNVDYIVHGHFSESKNSSPSVIVKYDKKGDLIFLRE